MTVAVKEISNLKRELTIELPLADIESAYQAAINKYAKDADIKGFRKGKVPANVIEQRSGDAIRQDIIGDLMQKAFVAALTEHKLEPVAAPVIDAEPFDKTKPYIFKATIEVYPSIEVKDLSGVKIEKVTAEVSDDDVKKVIGNLRKQSAEWAVVDRAAKDGDRLKIDFKGTLKGEAFDGGSAEDFTLELGSKSMVPGFEDGLVGLKAGEEKTLKMKMPKDYHADLADKKVEFAVTVKEVEEAKLPEIDDAFVAKVGVKEGGIKALDETIKKNLGIELKQAIDNILKKRVLDELVSLNPVEVPEGMIDAEIKQLQQTTLQQIAQQQGMKEVPKIDLPRDGFVDQAKERVTLGVLLSEYIKQQKLVVDEEKVRARIEEIASHYEGSQEVIDWYYKNEKMLADVQWLRFRAVGH